MIIVGGLSPRPVVRAVRPDPITPPPAITAGISHTGAIRHAQRVSQLMREVSAEARVRHAEPGGDVLADLWEPSVWLPAMGDVRRPKLRLVVGGGL